MLSCATLVLTAPRPAAGQDADAELAPEVAVPEVVVEVRPSHARLQRSVRFDEEGLPQRRDADLSLSLRAEFTTELQVLGVRQPKFTSITSSFGEELAIPEQRQEGASLQLERRGQEGEAGSVSFSIGLPDPPALRGIGEMRGTITVVVADGPRRELRFVPLERYTGRTAVVEDVGGAEVEVSGVEQGRVTFLFSSELVVRISAVGYAALGGAAQFDSNRVSFNTRFNDRMGMALRQDQIPEGGGVVFQVYPETREIELAWSCGPFDLPAPPIGAQGHLAIRTVGEGEAHAGEAPAAPDAVEPDRALPLRIGDQVQPMDG